ncbi:MAG: FUSC family protein [Rhodobacterales bacterium]|nr:FUSC family protein [Rhodobacterales bacterium]
MPGHSVNDPAPLPHATKAHWGLTMVLLVLAGLGAGIALALGDSDRALLVIFPLILTVAGTHLSGLRAGAIVGLTAALIVLVAAFSSTTPLFAAAILAGLILWTAWPDAAFSPPYAAATPLLLCYLVPTAFGAAAIGLQGALPFASAGLAAGVVCATVLILLRPRTDDSAHANDPAPPSPHLAAVLLGAAVSAWLLWYALTHASIPAAWILMTFIVVVEPEHPNTVSRSLRRIGGTLIGTAIVVFLTLLPARIETLVGMAAIAPAIAYNRVHYIVSVAATTVMIVTLYGAPEGDFLGWGIERIVDTAIGAALAIAVSALAALGRGRPA